MGTRLTDSGWYAHSWSTPGLDRIFEESSRIPAWLDILRALARAQADLGIIPRQAADDIGEYALADRLDLDYIGQESRRTSHSTLGLIRGLQAVLPESAREFVYYGITVQDLTDTWFAMAMRDTAALVRADLCRVETACLRLAVEHRDTVMAGRTHGQPGSPITFGLKAATWADETSRAIDRLDQGGPRWSVGQLAGSTGGLSFFGSAGPGLRSAFCAALGLGDPGISWTATRDRLAEFGTGMSMIATGLSRIGNEIYELQRPEIGELSEPRSASAVGSITMPHKQNPELSEHLDTLARLARASAGVLVEGMASSHERDGRAWKAEWVTLPEVALMAGKAAAVAADLVEGLQVHPQSMARNLGRAGTSGSEQVLVELSARLGKHRAQELLQAALATRSGLEDGRGIAHLIASQTGLDEAEVESWMDSPTVSGCGTMVDACVARIRALRA